MRDVAKETRREGRGGQRTRVIFSYVVFGLFEQSTMRVLSNGIRGMEEVEAGASQERERAEN